MLFAKFIGVGRVVLFKCVDVKFQNKDVPIKNDRARNSATARAGLERMFVGLGTTTAPVELAAPHRLRRRFENPEKIHCYNQKWVVEMTKFKS